MTAVFADTHYFLSLLNPADRAHRRASDFRSEAGGRLITSQFVLIEAGNALRNGVARAAFVMLITSLTARADVTIIDATSDLFRRGIALFQDRPDKTWSLTDCISFCIMTEMNVKAALTADHHFEQAGFQALLKA